jgi:hypothetical protein
MRIANAVTWPAHSAANAERDTDRDNHRVKSDYRCGPNERQRTLQLPLTPLQWANGLRTGFRVSVGTVFLGYFLTRERGCPISRSFFARCGTDESEPQGLSPPESYRIRSRPIPNWFSRSLFSPCHDPSLHPSLVSHRRWGSRLTSNSGYNGAPHLKGTGFGPYV